MQKAGYTDLQRGERGSSEEHLTVTQFKVEQENERLRQAQELSSAHLAAAEEYRRRKADMEQKAQSAQRKLDEIAPQVDDFECWAQQFSGESSDFEREKTRRQYTKKVGNRKQYFLQRRQWLSVIQAFPRARQCSQVMQNYNLAQPEAQRKEQPRQIVSFRTSFAISFCLLYTLRYKLKQKAGALCITPNWKPFL